MSYDDVEIEDMEWNEEIQAFTYPCPCGDLFQITKEDLKLGEEIARCPSCSLYITVIYNVEDFMDDKGKKGVEAEPEVVSYTHTQEREKALLISLHKVLSEVQMLMQALDVESESESETEIPKMKEKAYGNRGCSHCEEACVKRIVGDLVCMLGTESKFVQHSAVNVLVTFSEFMAESESDWETFVSSLSGCLELAMSNNHGQESVSVSSTKAVKPNLGNVNWSIVSSIIQIYRRILKFLKQDYEEKHVQVCLKYICSWLSCAPWSSICDTHVDLSEGDGHSESYCNKVHGPKLNLIFLGNLLQLFCSLADQGDCSEEAKSSELRCQVLCKIQKLVPLLSSWCLRNQRNGSSLPIYHYFKHKLLMLMVRLQTGISIDRSITHLCLELLHEYFEDILNKKLTLIKVADNVCLQDSPFSHSTYECGASKASQQHLQRLAILLFVKCTVTLIASKAEKKVRCACAKNLTFADLHVGCCSTRKGLSALYLWLLEQHPIDSYADYDTYVEKCMTFATVFLQLFVDEDDMLFQVLLQVSGLPSSGIQQFHEDKLSFQEMNCDIVFHISNIFNPMLLFHIFLAKLHYDHQILLDYLISKDVGLSCVEYLLRCLRRVSESWKSFMQYSSRKVSTRSNNKKRKTVPTVSEKDRSETAIYWFEQGLICLDLEKLSLQKGYCMRRFEDLCLIEEKQNLIEARI
ncbi:unnamed protein product [Rhodiola kirilowii]